MTTAKGRCISEIRRRRIGMFLTKKNVVMTRTLGVALVAALGLGGCATYKDEFATINSRLDTLDTRVQSAAQSAESANQSAQQANQRLDQIESRVQNLEAAPRRVPRG
jgi:murein lipoprotein